MNSDKFKNAGLVLMTIGFILLVLNLAYYTPRESFYYFFGQYMAAFALFYWLWTRSEKISFKAILGLAVLIRIAMIGVYPLLSDDFFRFIWDGEMLTRGINPYAHTPDELISHSQFMMDGYIRKLYHGMSELSQRNYTCYPVVNQLLYGIPAAFTESVSSFVTFYRIILILADIGVIFIGRSLLRHLQMPEHKIWLYALNPFILLEFTGNLHVEGVMLFFLLVGIWLVIAKKWLFGSVFMGLAIQIKIIPALILPFFLKPLGWRQGLGFLSATMLVVLLISGLLLDEAMFSHLSQSLGNYYTSFEFNGGIFTLVREAGMTINGWDPVQTAGPWMRNLSFAAILLLAAWRKYLDPKDLMTGLLFGITIYLALATTVHPWYVSTVLLFSVFTRYKFGLIWSFLVMLSYAAYSHPQFKENTLYLATEYLITFGVLGYEIFKSVKRTNFGWQIKAFFSQKNE